MPSIFTYTDKSELHVISARNIIKTAVWEGNRVMDEDHVRTLEASIKNVEEIQGPFSIVEYMTEVGPEYRIIDGQHRREVLRRYFERQEAKDFSVLTRRYILADRSDAIALFQQINLAKPMVYRGSSTERLHEIVRALTKEFLIVGSKPVQLIRPHCNRPFLRTEDLEEALKRLTIHEKDIPVELIVAHAVKMNKVFAENPSLVPKGTKIMLDRATEYKFFLGLDPKCSWLQGLMM
jgi:hypothetical protein